MSLLFGCMCNEPHRIGDALAPVREFLVAPAPVVRWGLGYAQDGAILLSRSPKLSEEDVDLYDAVVRHRSDYLIGHVGTADGLRGSNNCQPLRFRQWMFAQFGGAETFSEIHPTIVDQLPGFLARSIKGHTAAEHIFHLFLAFLHDAGTIDDPNLPVHDTRRSLRDALAMVYGMLTKAGKEAHLGNLVVSNSRSMLAVRLEAPLHVRRLKLTRELDEKGTFRGVFALAGVDEPGEGFEQIPLRSALLVHRDVTTEISRLDD